MEPTGSRPSSASSQPDFAPQKGWVITAAERGYIGAQNNSALIYEGKPGVETNYVEAYKWFTISSRSNATDGRGLFFKRTSQIHIDDIVKHMNASQIQEATRLADIWLENRNKGVGGLQCWNASIQ